MHYFPPFSVSFSWWNWLKPSGVLPHTLSGPMPKVASSRPSADMLHAKYLTFIHKSTIMAKWEAQAISINGSRRRALCPPPVSSAAAAECICSLFDHDDALVQEHLVVACYMRGYCLGEDIPMTSSCNVLVLRLTCTGWTKTEPSTQWTESDFLYNLSVILLADCGSLSLLHM